MKQKVLSKKLKKAIADSGITAQQLQKAGVPRSVFNGLNAASEFDCPLEPLLKIVELCGIRDIGEITAESPFELANRFPDKVALVSEGARDSSSIQIVQARSWEAVEPILRDSFQSGERLLGHGFPENLSNSVMIFEGLIVLNWGIQNSNYHFVSLIPEELLINNQPEIEAFEKKLLTCSEIWQDSDPHGGSISYLNQHFMGDEPPTIDSRSTSSLFKKARAKLDAIPENGLEADDFKYIYARAQQRAEVTLSVVDRSEQKKTGLLSGLAESEAPEVQQYEFRGVWNRFVHYFIVAPKDLETVVMTIPKRAFVLVTADAMTGPYEKVEITDKAGTRTSRKMNFGESTYSRLEALLKEET